MTNNPYAPAASRVRWKPTVLFWIVAVVVLLLVILFAFAGGIGAVLAILGVVALLTGLYTLLFKWRWAVSRMSSFNGIANPPGRLIK